MLILQQRIADLAEVAARYFNVEHASTSGLWQQAELKNPWFTSRMLGWQFEQWQQLLTVTALQQWVAPYPDIKEPKRIGLILAGNLPLVGFHDVLAVLVSGHRAVIKPSSEDEVLIKAFVEELVLHNTAWSEMISFSTGQLGPVDAVIATGSNNTNRYFEYYFRDIPSVLRRNRNSVAVLSGLESPERLRELALDVLLYFGRGCRSVSKLMLPRGFDIPALLDQWQSWEHLAHHNKYANNYAYHRALLLMNQDTHLDTGYLLLKEDLQLAAPVGMLFYEFYDTAEALKSKLKAWEPELQCVVSDFQIEGIETVPFGKSQCPGLTDYADGVNTLDFLFSLD